MIRNFVLRIVEITVSSSTNTPGVLIHLVNIHRRVQESDCLCTIYSLLPLKRSMLCSLLFLFTLSRPLKNCEPNLLTSKQHRVKVYWIFSATFLFPDSLLSLCRRHPWYSSFSPQAWSSQVSWWCSLVDLIDRAKALFAYHHVSNMTLEIAACHLLLINAHPEVRDPFRSHM